MSLWRLPPVVIIQLKRFQFTQHMRRKLRDFVVFPVEGLDLSRIMAPDTSEDSLKTFEDEESEVEMNSKYQVDDKPKKGSEKNDDEPNKGALSKADDDNDPPEEEAQPVNTLEENDDDNDTNETDETESSPLTNQDDGRSEMLYDLYGVVHHQGALSGGHYVASLKSELDGQWRLFNDAQIYEIHSRDVVDSSAYILFYIRRDVLKAKLSDFWDTNHREGEGLTEEDMDKLIRGRSDRCVIS